MQNSECAALLRQILTCNPSLKVPAVFCGYRKLKYKLASVTILINAAIHSFLTNDRTREMKTTNGFDQWEIEMNNYQCSQPMFLSAITSMHKLVCKGNLSQNYYKVKRSGVKEGVKELDFLGDMSLQLLTPNPHQPS